MFSKSSSSLSSTVIFSSSSILLSSQQLSKQTSNLLLSKNGHGSRHSFKKILSVLVSIRMKITFQCKTKKRILNFLLNVSFKTTKSSSFLKFQLRNFILVKCESQLMQHWISITCRLLWQQSSKLLKTILQSSPCKTMRIN